MWELLAIRSNIWFAADSDGKWEGLLDRCELHRLVCGQGKRSERGRLHGPAKTIGWRGRGTCEASNNKRHAVEEDLWNLDCGMIMDWER